MLAERFPEAQVDAIDLSPSMVEAARERSAGVGDRARFAIGDAATLPFDEQTFDLVVQLNMPVFPGQIARVLRPGGHVIVASSLGAATPYYTPERLLRRRFAKLGFVDDAIAQTGPGTFFLARRADGSPADDALRRFYDKSAGRYDRQISFFERVLFAGGREWVCSQGMLELARKEAARVRPDADLREGNAEALDFPDESFDTVTCTLALCTIPDDRAAVAEAMRVLRPGGRLVLLEHVRSPVRGVRRVQHLLEPLSLRFEHDHLMREPLEHVRDVGFVVERLERSKLGIVERLAARKPS